MKAFAIAVLAATALAGAAPAFATDFTFTVPVTIENAPTAASITVACYVSVVPPGGANAPAAANLVGRGEKVQALANGAFHGNVVVEVNSSGEPATAAKSYSCQISALTGKPVNGSSWSGSPGNMQQIFEKATGKKVDHMTLEGGGALP